LLIISYKLDEIRHWLVKSWQNSSEILLWTTIFYFLRSPLFFNLFWFMATFRLHHYLANIDNLRLPYLLKTNKMTLNSKLGGIHNTLGVNFVNVLRATFMHADPKAQKDSQVVIFCAFGICTRKSCSYNVD